MKEKQGARNGTFQAPTKHFTQISNQVLRDANLSLAAKGLFSLIASYITLPEFTLYKKYIHSQCKEGRHAFDSAWKELQQAGYLTHQQARAEDGTFAYQYSLTLPVLDTEKPEVTPTTKTPSEKFYIDATGNTDKMASSSSKNTPNFPTSEEKKSVCLFSSPLPPAPVAEKQTPALLYSNKNTILNKTQSIKNHRQKLNKQVEWQYFATEPAFAGAPRQTIDLLLDFLASQRHAAQKGEGALCMEQINQVDSCTLLEFLQQIQARQPKRVHHPKAYLTAAFKNYLSEQSVRLLWV